LRKDEQDHAPMSMLWQRTRAGVKCSCGLHLAILFSIELALVLSALTNVFVAKQVAVRRAAAAVAEPAAAAAAADKASGSGGGASVSATDDKGEAAATPAGGDAS